MLGLFVVAVHLAHLPAHAQSPAAGNHIVIISLDGFTARALADPALPLPNLRRLAAAGAMAKTMRPVNPTVTWANHTAMITGVTPAKHGVVYNGLLVREPGLPPRVEPWRDKSEMVHAQTLYDVAHARGLTTAQVDWVAIWNAPTVTWEFRERPDPNGPIAQEMVAAGIVTREDVETFASKNIVLRDHIWTEAAAHIIRVHKPNLMMFHLLTLDSVQHRYGPDTLAAQSTMAHLDAQVGAIVQAVEEAGIGDRTTFFVVSDHGFKRVKRQINPNVALVKEGLVQVADGKVVKADAWVMPEGGISDCLRHGARSRREALGATEDGAPAESKGSTSRLSHPTTRRWGCRFPPRATRWVSSSSRRRMATHSPHPSRGEIVTEASEGSLGTHGYVSTDPELGAIFIASGRGIKPGVSLESVSTIDLAATMAQLLGFELKEVEGRVLTDILADK